MDLEPIKRLKKNESNHYLKAATVNHDVYEIVSQKQHFYYSILFKVYWSKTVVFSRRL